MDAALRDFALMTPVAIGLPRTGKMRIGQRSTTSRVDARKGTMRLIVASWITRSSSIMRLIARVVKLVYTAGLKPAAANHGMPVRFRSLAPHSVHFIESRINNCQRDEV